MYDAGLATRFYSLAQPNAMPRELASHVTPAEFQDIMERVNASIQWGIDQRKQCCWLVILVWLTGLGALFVYWHIFWYHYPKAHREIRATLQLLEAKGLRVTFLPGANLCTPGVKAQLQRGGPLPANAKNRIVIAGAKPVAEP